MKKRVGMTAEDAAAFQAGRPVKKKRDAKKVRAETDDLGDRVSERVGTKAVRKAETVTDSTVGAAELRGVMEETMARVYGEIWPGMRTHHERGWDHGVDSEIGEEAYILSLYMMFGDAGEKPRRGVKVREVEISDNAHYCKEHMQ